MPEQWLQEGDKGPRGVRAGEARALWPCYVMTAFLWGPRPKAVQHLTSWKAWP